MSRALMIGTLATTACAFAVAADQPKPVSSEQRVFQLRTYTIRDGQEEALHRRFREHGCALFKKHGIEVVGFWTPQDEKDGKGKKLVYMVAFPSMDAARKSWKSFGGDPEWKRIKAETNKDGDLVDRWEAVYLDPTDFSPMK